MRKATAGWALLLLLVSAAAIAQEQTVPLEGIVSDATGSVLPGVSIEALNSRGLRFTTTTDKDGRYRFPAIPPGTYTLTASLSGMERALVKNIEVTLATSPKVDIKMKVAAVAEAITVSAEAPIVDVQSSAAQTSMRSEVFEQLPRGRDFATIVTYAPSANQNNKSGGISIDGASGAENRFIMDGVDTTNPQTGVQGKVLVTDFVDEVQVKSAGYQAEFGGATGGVINVITKTGTNDLRGSVGAYDNERSWGGNARPVLQLNTAGTSYEQFQPRKDSDRNLEPAVTLGGPLLKDRLWFYAGYQPQIESTTRTITFVPSQGGQTRSYDQDFRRDNWVGNLTGSVGSKFLYKATYNNSGYTTTNLLPGVTGRSNPDASLYGPDDKFANWTGSGYADFVANPSWFFSSRGGRFYRNYTQQGISKDVRVIFTSGSPSQFPEVPTSLIQAAGYSNIPTNTASQKDAYTRDNLNFDGSWFPQFAGTHRIKAGVQFDNIANDVLRGQQNYLVTTYWNGVCDFCSTRGKYGSAGVYVFQTTGHVKSENTGFFVQDSWTTMRDRLTLNLGVRTEQEKVPSYAQEGTPTTGKYAINFKYGDKFAPRLGFSYDLFGNGRSKAYGSYGIFYDITKMEMPRGSFGGDKWIYWGFSLDSFDWSQWNKCQNVTNDPNLKPTCPGMTLQGGVDLRHPSNSADLPLIDPNLKPMESREFSLGFQQEVGTNMAVGFRWVNKSLIRAIEDVGVHVTHADGSESEDFFIANPGFGVAQKILAATGCASCPAMPKAKRDYNGFEFEFTRRFTQRWSAHVSYLYSKLDGNYSGLANSDEITANPGFARTSPNVSRNFDGLFMLFDQNGKTFSGNLGDDRPHQAKAQVTYALPFGTTFGLSEYFYSGTPTTTEMRFQSVPFFPYGRGDMGRTPNITETDLNIAHDLRLGRYAVQVGAIVLNLFDEKKVTNIYPIYSTSSIRLRDLSKCGADLSVAGCGSSSATPLIGGSTVNAQQSAAFFQGFDAKRQAERQRQLGSYTLDFRYGQPNTYQDAREVRVYVKFLF
jgi:carboxypeptidase family protein